MRRTLALAALAIALVPALPCVAADDPAAARERTREAILYGIDSEVLEVIKQLKASTDPSFSDELARVLGANRSVELRRGILELFADTKAPAGRAYSAGDPSRVAG